MGGGGAGLEGEAEGIGGAVDADLGAVESRGLTGGFLRGVEFASVAAVDEGEALDGTGGGAIFLTAFGRVFEGLNGEDGMGGAEFED